MHTAAVTSQGVQASVYEFTNLHLYVPRIWQVSDYQGERFLILLRSVSQNTVGWFRTDCENLRCVIRQRGRVRQLTRS